jgi:hypothetical protein
MESFSNDRRMGLLWIDPVAPLGRSDIAIRWGGP